jgi:peptidoglycan/xylan/chitin deacetylase (PgdA/CDA1 family)
MYHRIGDDGRDPWYLRVDPRRFDEQLELLCERYRPVTLQEMVVAATAGEVPPGAVAVTFDDGYEDFFTAATPVLERRGMPATLFVATGFVQHQRPFPWEQLEELFLGSGELPERVDIALDGTRHRWLLERGPAITLETEDDRSWKRSDPPRGARDASFLALAPVLERMPRGARAAAIQQLERWAGRLATPPPSRRPLTIDQLQSLADSDLIEIGSHTVWHPLLPTLPRQIQRFEVAASREWLEDITGEEVLSFAYPAGAFGDTTKTLVSDSGYRAAVTIEKEAVTAEVDPFAIPRLVVDDTPIEIFEERLIALMRDT